MKLLLLIFATVAWGQTKVTPAQLNGTGVPSAPCVVGQTFFRTDATAGENKYSCTATDTWTPEASVTLVQSGQLTFCSSATGNDSYACNISPAFTAYDVNGVCLANEICSGTLINFITDVANTGAATFAPNGLAAKDIRKGGTLTALKTGDVAAGQVVSVVYNRTAGVWQYQSQLSIDVTGGTNELYQWGLCINSPCVVGANLTSYVIVSQATTLSKCYAAAKTAPTGANLIIDVLKSGVSIFGGGTKLVIVAGATTGNQATIANATLAESDNLTIDITQIGSTIAGQDVSVKCKGSY